MANYEDGDSEAESLGDQIPDRQLNKIIDDHIIGMQQKKVGTKLRDEGEDLKKEREL